MISLEILKEQISSCTSCELHKTRKNVVVSRGNPQGKLIIIGEAPGAEEDEKGIPFCGRSGNLLDAMIAAMGLSNKDDVYVMNTIKCRPPNNRKPTETELSSCRNFFDTQLSLLKSKVIVALGATASETILGSVGSISKIRGTWFNYKDKKVMPTFHPAYLLRNQAAKTIVAEDLKLVLKELNA